MTHWGGFSGKKSIRQLRCCCPVKMWMSFNIEWLTFECSCTFQDVCVLTKHHHCKSSSLLVVTDLHAWKNVQSLCRSCRYPGRRLSNLNIWHLSYNIAQTGDVATGYWSSINTFIFIFNYCARWIHTLKQGVCMALVFSQWGATLGSSKPRNSS